MKDFIVTLFCLVFMEVCSMNEVILVPQYDFGALKIRPVVAPAWGYDSKYNDDEVILKGRAVCEAIRASDLGSFCSEKNMSLYCEVMGNFSKHLGSVPANDMELIMEHIALIETENGDLDCSPSVRLLYSNNGIFDYFSSAVLFNETAVAQETWEKVCIIFTAFRDSTGNPSSDDEGCRAGYIDRIQYVIDSTQRWPVGNFLSWAIRKALSDTKI